MNSILRRFRTFFLGFLSIHLIWAAAYLIKHTTVIPNPIEVYLNFGEVFSTKLLMHILFSLRRIGAGLALSLVIGVPVGILMATSRKANQLLYPFVYFSYPIPKTALLPVAMLLWGMHDGSKVAIIFLIIVFQVIVAVRDSVISIDPRMYQVIRSTGAGRGQMIRHVTLPAVLPQLLTSVRVSLGTAVSVLFFVEGYGTKYGMGYYILDSWSRIDYIEMYIGIIVIAVVGFVLFEGIDLLAGKLCRWEAKGSGTI